MIDVIVPVYRGEEEVRRCLASVWASTCATPYELVVIDDCSPEPALSAWLDALAEAGRITLLRNARNLGFVGTVNRGMALHPERDVLLLNGDTEVANDWLDRIVRCAAAADVATVTPFSNNATICSYPFNGWRGEVPGTLGLAALDRLFARVNAGGAVALPTAVGFCMFIRRASLDALGLFDAERFGRGYGEENDFSMRALKAGWRNLLCADTFVYHHGGVSFGAERDDLMRRGGQALLELHPDYDERVAAFVAADPVQPFRAAVDAARIACGAAEAAEVRAEQSGAAAAGLRPRTGARATAGAAPARHGRIGRPVVLHVSHSWGGGVERWTRDFAAADERGWHLLLRSRSGRNDASVRLELMDVLGGDEPLLGWDLAEPIAFTAVRHAEYGEIFADLVEGFDVEAVVVSSLIGHALDALRSGRPTLVMLHDFYPFCPALFAWFGHACTSCTRSDLQRCLDANPLNVFWNHKDLDAWEALRAAYAECLAAGHVRVAAPSRSVHERYARLFPALAGKPWTLVPHGLAAVPERLPPAAADGAPRRLRVLVPGRLAPHKGLHLVQAMLPELQAFCELLLLGSGEFGEPFAGLEHVGFVRDYGNGELAARVAEFGPDCALLLSTLPETFSYTLSEMQALGVPVVATRVGAFAERIDDGRDGFLVAPEPDEIVARLRTLAASPAELRRVREALHAAPVRTAARMAADCRALFGDGGTAPPPLAGVLVAALHDARREAGARQAAVAERDAGLAAAHARIAALADESVALRRQLEAQRARAERAEQRLHSVSSHRDALLASTSWRVTRPLRAVTEALAGRPGMPADDDASAGAHAGTDAAPPPNPPGRAVIAARRGDPIVWRRAQWLAAEAGRELVDAGAWPAAAAEDAADLAAGMLDGGGFHAAARCFDGGDEPAAAATVRVVVPSRAVAARLAAPGAVVAPCPPLGDAGSAERRSVERAGCRQQLQLPDATRIVLGVGRADARSGLLRFARLAMELGARRTGCCFVWLGGRDDAWVGAHWAQLGLPVSLRRLFIVEDEDFERWMLAADAYLGCREAGVYDNGVLEALAAGLPVAVESAESLPDVLREPEFARKLALAAGDEALPQLAAWLEAAPTSLSAPQPASAQLLRQGLEPARLAKDFVAAMLP